MSFQSSYRVFRPTNFEQIVAQDHIIKTLTNALEQKNLAHAYLFNGPRGTGKTSIAKIFARKMNCTCFDNTCTICTSKSDYLFPDIIEIDAASNNSVEEIRKIIEAINFLPLQLMYKVYIVDEIHMLSKSAFNALLKTLEEPPAHVKFILATTEIGKIPLTIISRCQRFDFKKITSVQISQHLKLVAKNLNIFYDHEAIDKLAKLSDGSMRDALSLLDKVKMYNNDVTIISLQKSLNLLSELEMQNLFDFLYEGDELSCIKFFEEIYLSGVDSLKFIVDFQYFIHEILIDVISLRKRSYHKSNIIVILKKLNELEQRLLYTKNYKILIEVFFLDICLINKKYPLEKISIASDEQNTESQTIATQQNTESQTIVTQQNIESQTIATQQNTESQTIVTQQNIESQTIVTQQKNSAVSPKQQNTESQTIVAQQKNSAVPPEITNKQQNLTLLDILFYATILDKKKIIEIYPVILKKLQEDKKIGMAKFFEHTQVCAASPHGCVIIGEDIYIKTYQKRIFELNQLFSVYLNTSLSIILMSTTQWQQNRHSYLEQIKQLKDKKTLYEQALDVFGQHLVTKI